MYWAAERRGGKIVHADKARAFGEYRCPSCRAEVFLRSGSYRVNHFAHKAHQGKPECEEFHFSGNLARPQAVAAPTAIPRVGPLALAIELEPDASRRRLPQWRPCLIVPKAPDTHGEIIIDLGPADTRRISVAKLALGHQVYRVDPRVEDFAASWVSRDVCREYREAVQGRIGGLDPRAATAFSVSTSKQKLRAFALFWGESYYLVWHSDISLVLPSNLVCRQFERCYDWDCALISLPHKPAADIEEWLLANADVTVARTSRNWSLFYPPPYATGDNGELRILSSQNVLLALSSPSSSEAGKLTLSGPTASSELELSSSRTHIVSIRGAENHSDASVAIAWDGMYVSVISPTRTPEVHSPISVVIECTGPNGKQFGQFHLGSGRALLTSVRARELLLVGIRGHQSLTGQLLVTTENADTCVTHDLAFSTKGMGGASLSDELRQIISSCLLDTSLDVVLNFGPFGIFRADAARHEFRVAEDNRVRLTPSLRARIEWLSRACRAYVDARRTPIGELSDAALLRHHARLRVPGKFGTYRRSIDAQLRATRHGGGHE